MKKYKFTGVTKSWIKGKTLRQIMAVRDFGNVHAGDLGGFIEKEENLSHDGDAWITKTAVAYGDCRIYGNAYVTGMSDISGNARICDDAWVGGQTPIGNSAWICGKAKIKGRADYIFIHGVGNNGGVLTCFRDKNGAVMVRVHPDFIGPLDEFRKYILEKYGNGQNYGEYITVIELIELHFGLM